MGNKNAPCQFAEGGKTAVPPQFTDASQQRPYGVQKLDTPCLITGTTRHSLLVPIHFQPTAPECIFLSAVAPAFTYRRFSLPTGIFCKFHSSTFFLHSLYCDYSEVFSKSQGKICNYRARIISSAFCSSSGVISVPPIIRATSLFRPSKSRG